MTNSRHNATGRRRKISSVQGRFTPCKRRLSLLEPMTDAAKNAAGFATILLSPARSSFDGFQNARNGGEKLYSVEESISWGEQRLNPNRNGEMAVGPIQKMDNVRKQNFSLRGFLREKHGANNPTNSTSLQKGRQQRQTQ